MKILFSQGVASTPRILQQLFWQSGGPGAVGCIVGCVTEKAITEKIGEGRAYGIVLGQNRFSIHDDSTPEVKGGKYLSDGT